MEEAAAAEAHPSQHAMAPPKQRQKRMRHHDAASGGGTDDGGGAAAGLDTAAAAGNAITPLLPPARKPNKSPFNDGQLAHLTEIFAANGTPPLGDEAGAFILDKRSTER